MPPIHQPIRQKYDSHSELLDLILHMEHFCLGIRSHLYEPVDEDFQGVAREVFKAAAQLREFYQVKRKQGKPPVKA